MPENVDPFDEPPLPGLDAPAPDPGNSPPEAWTEDLDGDALDDAYADLNDTAVHLPEPDAA